MTEIQIDLPQDITTGAADDYKSVGMLSPNLWRADNLVIAVTAPGCGGGQGFSCFMSDCVPDNGLLGGTQCFPIWLYEPLQLLGESEGRAAAANLDTQDAPPIGDLFSPLAQNLSDDGEQELSLYIDREGNHYARRSAITNEGLAHFRAPYDAAAAQRIGRHDVFFYVYGILHSPDYRERYADNLSKELPRIPRVKTIEDFWAFSLAGRELGLLHVGYEDVPMHQGCRLLAKRELTSAADYRVDKRWRLVNKGDRSAVRYNDLIQITEIPERAWDYQIVGRSALEWIMDRQAVRVDKASGIVNDANDWASDVWGNPKYPLELFLRVITVSLRTMDIVDRLPALGDISGN